MKTLLEYLQEKTEIIEASEESKTFEFNFNDIENKDDILKSFTDMDNVEVDGDVVKLTVSKDNMTDPALEILQSTIERLRKSSQSINNEQYAQKTKNLKVRLSEVFDYIDTLNDNEEEEEGNKEDKEDDEK